MIGLMSMPGIQPAETRATRDDLVEVADQRLAGPRVLDLDRHVAAVAPDGPVHLADRGGRGGGVVERRELAPPAGAELVGQDTVCTTEAGIGGAASCSLVSVAR